MSRPANVSRPALALAAVAFALFGIARTTGSGWLIVVLTGIGSVVGLAVVLPWWSLRGITIEVATPRDATVGRMFDATLEVAAGGAMRPLRVRLLGFDGPAVGVVTPARGRRPLGPQHRGVFDHVDVEIATAAPLGLVWWCRRMTVPLARPLEVGPMAADVGVDLPRGIAEGSADEGLTASPSGDAVRSLRTYVAGDARKLVHWPASARAGELMVKELEAPSSPALCLAVDLSGPTAAAEMVAARAAGLALLALRGGVAVTILTREIGGGRVGVAETPGEVNRRLARAVAGPLPDPPLGVLVHRVTP